MLSPVEQGNPPDRRMAKTPPTVRSDLRPASRLLVDARKQGNRQSAIRLSGSSMSCWPRWRNEVTERMVKEMVTRTSLIIGMHGVAGTSNCHDDEHGDIPEALRNMNGDAAANPMADHLHHIEHQVNWTSERKRQVGLVEILAGKQGRKNCCSVCQSGQIRL